MLNNTPMSDELLRMKLHYLSQLNELDARHYAALWALEIGWGGISKVNELTGKAIDTIRKGIAEMKTRSYKELKESGRIRREGAGRKKIEEKNPKIKKDLEKIMNENAAGSPMSSLKWTHKSISAIADELKKIGYKASRMAIYSMVKELGYTLQGNKKSKEGKHSKERDDQFRYINSQFKDFAMRDQPSISVDTKKKELVGGFKNPGKTWRKKGQPEVVNVYDFPSLADGKAVPYGAYDPARNEGFVNVGVDNDTAEFSVESIRQWWHQLGKERYPNAKELLISADCGGSNGYRNRGWKFFLQQLSNETGLEITVVHFPPGTSKWNKIEHKLFSFISMNWRGKPLVSYKVIINLISATKTDTGLKVFARLDKKKYKKGRKFSDKQMKELNIEKHSLHPDWNYTILPKKN